MASEQSCYEWYLYRSSIKLPGAFYSDRIATDLFWAFARNVVLRHAILALSSAHREEVLGHTKEQMCFTLAQYNKALAYIRSNIWDVDVLSTTCLLFVYMEYLRGCYANGLLHLRFGLRLLQDTSSTKRCGWSIPAFTSVLVQTQLAGQLLDIVPVWCFRVNMYELAFNSYHYAKYTLDCIILRALLRRKSFSANSEDLVEDLRRWSIAFKAMPAPNYQEKECFAHKLLHIYYCLTLFLIDTCRTDTELAGEKTDVPFFDIVGQCEEMFQMRFDAKAHRDPESTSSNSVSDVGWIAPLYYAAVHCRDHNIRLQALNLLESSSHKEGIWNSQLAVAVVKQVLKIEGCERNNLDPDILHILEWDNTNPSRSSEVLRITQLNVILPDDYSTGILTLKCRYGQQSLHYEYNCCSGKWRNCEFVYPGLKFWI